MEINWDFKAWPCYENWGFLDIILISWASNLPCKVSTAIDERSYDSSITTTTWSNFVGRVWRTSSATLSASIIYPFDHFIYTRGDSCKVFRDFFIYFSSPIFKTMLAIIASIPSWPNLAVVSHLRNFPCFLSTFCFWDPVIDKNFNRLIDLEKSFSIDFVELETIEIYL